jgi:hypothetical protein
MLQRLYLAVLILFCLELGLFLAVLPWSSLWERNYFLYRYPAAGTWLLNHYLRGAISGLGLADILVGLWQAAHFRQLLTSRSIASSPATAKPVAGGQTA